VWYVQKVAGKQWGLVMNYSLWWCGKNPFYAIIFHVCNNMKMAVLVGVVTIMRSSL
jgi:hypothetical protein